MNAQDELFKSRTPEAAARQLAVVLAWSTECSLATLERLQSLKSSSASEVRRQQSICETSVRQCMELGVQPVGLSGLRCARLAELLTGVSLVGKRQAAQASEAYDQIIGNDPLYELALAVVRQAGRPSLSLVQRHLMIGYNRAATLLEAMEAAGVVSPMGTDGSRKLLAVA